MDNTQPPRPLGAISSLNGTLPARRPPRGGARAHPLVASLADGLQAAYAAQPVETMPDIFASLVARLDHDEPDAR